MNTLFTDRSEALLLCLAAGEIIFYNQTCASLVKNLSGHRLKTGENIFAILPEQHRQAWQKLSEQAINGWAGTTFVTFSLADNHKRHWLLSFAPAGHCKEPVWSLLALDTTDLQNQISELQLAYRTLENQFIDETNHVETNILLAKEIAERKIAEENLLESKERLTQIIDGNSIPTFVLDKHHKITHWNKALARLTGLSSLEAVGHDVQWKAFYTHKRPTMADLVLEQAPETEIRRYYTNKYRRSVLLENSYEVEDCFEWYGESRWLFFTAAPLVNRAGEIIGAVETLQDITARKEMEQEILRYQDILEKKVEERTLQFKKTYEQLLHAEKLSAVGKLAASIAHEFGNPIIGIRNFLKGLKKTATMDQNDSEMLDLAIEECQRVKDLISNLQNFNRPTSGVTAPMDLHKAIDDMLLFCKKSFKEKKIVVRKNYTPDMPKITAVEDQIKQVILNCLNNAQEAIPKKGGSIQLTTAIKGDQALLQITDSGKGIKEKDVIHIFEPFFSTKPAVEGTGLGLSVSYGIMKKHRGDIEVTRTSKHGTTFTLSLPINDET